MKDGYWKGPLSLKIRMMRTAIRVLRKQVGEERLLEYGVNRWLKNG